jgi:uncharacterized surface protein with fasciclin (FAS1) repeats
MRRILLTLTAAVTSIGLLAASAGPAGADHQPSIVGVVVAASGAPGTFDTNGDDYDILREAVLAAGLADALSGGSWTVFAPNDRAFGRLFTDLTGQAPTSEAATLAAVAATAGDLLGTVLLHHVVAGDELTRTEVIRSRTLTMASGGTLGVRGVRLVDADPDLRDARIVVRASNIPAANGVIHTIDRVLLPLDL